MLRSHVTQREKHSKPNLKEKGIVVSSEKSKKKPMPKINEVPRRKRKFLADSTIVAKKGNVDF